MTRKYLLKRDKEDERDFLKAYTPHIGLQLPTSVDLRPMMPPIFDQGQLGSCSANAGVAYYEFMKQDRKHYSRLDLYYNERVLENTVTEDSGATMRDIGRALAKCGVCEEQYFPYDVTKFANTPAPVATANALQNKITSYSRLRTIKDIVTYIALHQKPVLMGMEVFESMEGESVARTGILASPKPGEQNFGGHAVLIVGYVFAGGKYNFIVRNSWGAEWGDKGHFHMSEDYIRENHAFDFWVLNK